VCRKAQPNKAHEILVALEREMGERFCLVTQNVDGLHLRAGHEPRLCLQIHGNLDFMRCLAACTTELFEFDDERGFVDGFPRCPHCNAPARPHVLWFDEYYDEQYYRARSAMDAALAAEAMIIIGASGAANLPLQMASCVARRGGLLVDINLEDSELSNIVERAAGMIVRRPAIDALLDIRALQ
jgi:NAD-dependent deacetylase